MSTHSCKNNGDTNDTYYKFKLDDKEMSTEFDVTHMNEYQNDKIQLPCNSCSVPGP